MADTVALIVAAGRGERLGGHEVPRLGQQLVAPAQPDLGLELHRRIAEAPSETLFALGEQPLHLLRLG